MAVGPFHDAHETRTPEAREAALLARLAAQVAHAKARSKPYAELLHGVDAKDVRSHAALARLPILRKSELLSRQRAEPPFAGAVATDTLLRVFQSPGPMYAPQSDRPDFARLARAMTAAGFRRRDMVHIGFTFHFTPGAWMMDSAARALGCPVFPGGVGNTEQQAQTIAELKPRCYAGTPSFLKIILEKGRELGLDLSALKAALVSGEAFPPSLQKEIAGFGVDAYQCYATADLGLIAYETSAREGLVIDEDVLVEIVRPGTGDPVPDGEVGEVVVTNFSPDYPLLRFATGDLSAIMAGASPCGRTNKRLKGWMGRADQTTKVKGMFVHPHQVAEVLKRHPEVKRGRLVVTQAGGLDVMTLRCETEARGGLAEALKASIQTVCKLKGEVELVPPGALPNDGKVIEDARTYA
jgi:phenylacetate-CoA ligase